MKGRSQRLPAPAYPPDDWGDGSWTVDCSCGVTFDDGEEMVNCDECGVWVHTRCSRFVKGEASFACDKCKIKNPRSPAGNNTSVSGATNTEETEVAQLLVELPTKTGPCPPPASQRPPFRLWTDVPIEERVHVQGVPGGDPALFQGLSSVFTSELWKCTGYVPKKFNFQYKEFPCWEEDETENPASRGADLLVSLSNDIVPYVPIERFERKPPLMGSSRKEGKVLSSSSGRLQSCVKKDRNKIRLFGVSSGKRRRDEVIARKDQILKKKARSDSDKNSAADIKQRGSISVPNACKADFFKDPDFQVPKSDFEVMKNEGRREVMSLDSEMDSHFEGTNLDEKLKHVLVAKNSSKILSDEDYAQKLPLEMTVKAEIVDQKDPPRTEITCRTDGPASPRKPSDISKVLVKKEDVSIAVDGLKQLDDESNYLGDLNGGSSSVAVVPEISKCASGGLGNSITDVAVAAIPQDSKGAISLSSVEDKITLKSAGVNVQGAVNSEMILSGFADKKLDIMEHLTEPQRSIEQSSKKLQVYETASSSPSDKHKPQMYDMEPDGRPQDNGKVLEKSISRSHEPDQHGQDYERSAEPSTLEQSSLELTCDLKCIREPTKLGNVNPSPSVSDGHRLVVGLEKSSSSPVSSRASVSIACKSPGTTTSSTAVSSIHLTKQRVKVKPHIISKKDAAANVVSREESRHEMTRQSTKNYPRVSTYSGSKSSLQTSKLSHVSSSKDMVTGIKEQRPHPSSKAPNNVTLSSGSGEFTASSQSQNASGQINSTASGSLLKSERTNQSIFQPPSKVFNHSIKMHPPACINASMTLSDEELALLLHQELNSSPRVPRVPRVRHAGGVPLASPTATSMLSKRSTVVGGRDQISVFRRKNKEDSYRESSQNSLELIGKSRKEDRSPSSNMNQHDSVLMTDSSPKRDAHKSPDFLASTKNNVQIASTACLNSCSLPIEANEQNALSQHSLPKDFSDDDVPASRTLPGLIDEIMSKGRRMSYEELCNAVFPHWQHLRKPNGDRYAYSSHSQAVLDCLRNRNKWAHLIDRGPKTSLSRKKRKHDNDLPPVESESEEAKNNVSRDVEGKDAEKPEDVPKGKRKARKRRRLALQGRGPKVRRRPKQDATSDDEDVCSFSQSSNEGSQSVFSEDESQEARQHAVGSEISTSSSDESD